MALSLVSCDSYTHVEVRVSHWLATHALAAYCVALPVQTSKKSILIVMSNPFAERNYLKIFAHLSKSIYSAFACFMFFFLMEELKQ